MFSSGVALAPFVATSGLLQRSWDVISSRREGIVSEEGVGLSWKVYKEPDTDVTIIAFQAAPEYSDNLQADLVSSSELREKDFLHFDFLCTKKFPLFYVNRTAVSLFCENLQRLDQLKSQINSSPQVIVTGLALGGTIASLFTLSLLDSIGSGKKSPLCITFGSPLVGDKKFQEAISRSSTWNSCFLHIVSYKDPLPRWFITNHTAALSPRTCSYTPFGTFLLCSNAHSTCFENPDSILALLEGSIHDQSQVFQSIYYGFIVENLSCKAIFSDLTAQAEDFTDSNSLQASINLQLLALGLKPNMQEKQQQAIDIKTLAIKMETLETKFIQKRKTFDPARQLNWVKIDMAKLEWYKKYSKNQNIGYYDSYKKMYSTSDQDVIKFHKNLTNYWEKMVEEAEMKPQREGAAFRTRWLFAGTNYRRMVEPLDIAQYYREGGRDYMITKARPRHYKQLEDWLKEGKRTSANDSNSVNRQNVASILTIDSCFWAHVEEALISCKMLKDGAQSSDSEKEDAIRKLLEFEEYVYVGLMKYAVSPEIFLKESSYMAWWNEYKAIKGASYNSALARFMRNAYNYNVQYVEGAFNFD